MMQDVFREVVGKVRDGEGGSFFAAWMVWQVLCGGRVESDMNGVCLRRVLFRVFCAVLCLLGSACRSAMPELSGEGTKAYEVVKKAERFTNAAVGYAGETPGAVRAFRELLAEKNADAAFKALIQEATLPGQLYALCGLWYTDPAAFKVQVARYRTKPGKVATMIGCIVDEDDIAELVESKHPRAIRLLGPGDTMKAWWARNPNAEARGDIAGGYWPSELKGEKREVGR